ncbi:MULTISPECIES: RagB/SusD family nutrient uptake outer membrane protein [Niastella]|uniref:RagB/SusD family nutrient uptake outer membrane protein n=1 Tax=Niastella soli TaxID=2821487 RepID=A0ABS3YQ64_9BACT|nr:RagB/SusD family nutrient uptake outer membrane protein [Niastella soli]MBO9200054.1 RagB/SusD family nutrient uptake outer membrane protein [Niastella soli]
MFKNQLLALCALFMLALSCTKKDKGGDNETRPLNPSVKAVQDYLSQTTDLNSFGTSFQAATFAEADVSSGLTIFAPVNNAITAYDPNARVEAASLSVDEVKDHVVKGVIKKSDLTNGKKLIAISGKELLVTIEGDKILINGVPILNIKEDGLQVICSIADVLCKKPGNIEVTVMDATQWSKTDTLGKATGDATVTLYKSRDDFANNAQPAFTGKTTATGKISFSKVAPGTYYLVVKKDDKANYCEPVIRNGVLVAYKPLGVFQTGSQVNATPNLYGTLLGDFIFLDANGDGRIDANDKTFIPFEVTVTGNKTAQVTSFIGYKFNHLAAPFASKAAAQQFLDDLNTDIGFWHQQKTIMDGIMSDDADCSGMDNFCSLDNFTDPPTSFATSLWQAAYRYITSLNRVIMNVPLLNLPAAESDNLIGQARGLRGFVYLQLATYYGGVPLISGIPDDNQVRASLTDSYTFIKSDLTAAMNVLPSRFTGADHRRINADACKLLLARVAMAQDDYARAKQLSGELMQSGRYSLVAADNILISDENTEIIWNMVTGFVGAYAPYFSIQNSTFFPVTRFAEVLLINAEARVNMGELDATNVNLLLNRRGKQSVTFTDNAQARDAVRDTWKNELYREGQRFAKLVKWNKATEVLAPKGYNPTKNALWPIPPYILDNNPNVVQNPGY